MNDIDLQHLRTAIAVAWRSREHGNHPFGSLLADENQQAILEAENTVLTARDVTGHAETNLVRLASQQFSPAQLARCTLYTSTEPCAMCAAAIHWANIGRVVYGLGHPDFFAIAGPARDHLLLRCREVFARRQRPVTVLGPALEEEARAVHAGFWTASGA